MQFDQDEKLSPTEQRIQNDDERRRTGYSIGHLGGHTNGPKPETPERARERKARAIPEETFADDQELARLRHDSELKADIARDPHTMGKWCAEHSQGIDKDAGNERLMFAMLEDARNEDEGFTRSLSVLQDLIVRQRFQQGLVELNNKITPSAALPTSGRWPTVPSVPMRIGCLRCNWHTSTRSSRTPSDSLPVQP
jgi:hypothetical protein